jgi:transposase
MERYIGCDVHASSTTVSVRNASGKRLRRDVVETNGEALISYLQGLGGKQHLCLEESEWSQWLAEILWREVVELVVVQPERRRGSKSDAIDADDLSERVRTGDLGRVVFKDRGRYTDLRELVRAYDMITRDVVRTKNRLKGFYRSRGVRCPGGAVYRAESGAELARRLPRATQRAVSLLRGELEALEPLKGVAPPRDHTDPGNGTGSGPGPGGAAFTDRGDAAPIPDEAAVLVLLWPGDRDALLGGLGLI